nr:hypothetical protein [Tanacetum cinerariifolium]
MFLGESDKIQNYVGGLPDMIHQSVMASKLKTMHDAVASAIKLMDKKIRTYAERQIKNKRKENDNQQQQNKRHNTGRAYTVRPSEKRVYGGSLPKCSKCNYHHNGPCAPKCHKCNKVGHMAHDCRSSGNANRSFCDPMESLNPHVVAASKLPILNPNEFDLWKMRIEQYFLITDYSLWEVILNGDSPSPTRIVDEQRLAKKNELKARGTLLMALHDKH